MDLVAFDLETTGRDPESDRIVEFCFIQLDEKLRERGRWKSLVNPERPMPEDVIAIHGITDDMVAEKAPFTAHAKRIQGLTEGTILVAHNHRFDVQFLNNELRRAGQRGLSVNHPCIDTLAIERRVNSHRLTDMFARYTGGAMEGAHRSEADTAATVEVLRQQVAQHQDVLPEGLNDLIVPNLVKFFEPEAQLRDWMDHGHRFYRDATGVVRFGFGKYRDAPALDHPNYLHWMRNQDFPTDAKVVVYALLEPPAAAENA